MVITPIPKPKSNIVAFPIPVKSAIVWNYYRVTGSWKAIYTPTQEVLGEGVVDIEVKIDTRTGDEYIVEEIMAAIRDHANLHLLCVRRGFIYRDNMELVEFTVGEDTRAVRQSADMVRIYKKKSEGLVEFESKNPFVNTSGYTFAWRDDPYWVANVPKVVECERPRRGWTEPLRYGLVSIHSEPFRRHAEPYREPKKQRSLERMISHAISPTGRWLGNYDIPEIFKGQIGCYHTLRSVLKQVKMAALRISSITDKSKIDRIEVELRDSFKFLPQERSRASVLIFHRKDKGSVLQVRFFNEYMKTPSILESETLERLDHVFCPHVLNGIGLSETERDKYMSSIEEFRTTLNQIMNDAMGLL